MSVAGHEYRFMRKSRTSALPPIPDIIAASHRLASYQSDPRRGVAHRRRHRQAAGAAAVLAGPPRLLDHLVGACHRHRATHTATRPDASPSTSPSCLKHCVNRELLPACPKPKAQQAQPVPLQEASSALWAARPSSFLRHWPTSGSTQGTRGRARYSRSPPQPDQLPQGLPL